MEIETSVLETPGMLEIHFTFVNIAWEASAVGPLTAVRAAKGESARQGKRGSL